MSEQDTPQTPGEERPSGARSESGRRERGHRRHRHQQQQQPPTQQRSSRPDASINMDEVRELVHLIKENGLTEFELQRGDFRIRLSSNSTPELFTQQGFSPHPPPPPVGAQGTQQATHGAPQLVEQQQQAAASKEEDLHVITSPIVGTFYRSSSPTSEPFIRIGSRVETDTVVCIIEAMKLMNEIQAEASGEIVKIYVENGQPVEYGQPLFGIKV